MQYACRQIWFAIAPLDMPGIHVSLHCQAKHFFVLGEISSMPYCNLRTFQACVQACVSYTLFHADPVYRKVISLQETASGVPATPAGRYLFPFLFCLRCNQLALTVTASARQVCVSRSGLMLSLVLTANLDHKGCRVTHHVSSHHYSLGIVTYKQNKK